MEGNRIVIDPEDRTITMIDKNGREVCRLFFNTADSLSGAFQTFQVYRGGEMSTKVHLSPGGIIFQSLTAPQGEASFGLGGIIGLLNLLSGGSLSKMSVFALSIYPYITASIIIQLLTIAIPRLGEIAKEGEQVQKKIGFYTKIGAVILGIFEGYALVQGMLFRAIDAKGSLEMSIILITIFAGSMFLIWLGDLITERGIGNGISILIFLGIVSGFPEQFGS